LIDQGKWEAAIPPSRALVQSAPHNEIGFRLLSIALSHHGDHDEAIRAARQAVAHAPTNWLTYTALANALLLSGPGGRREALEAARDGVRLAPNESRTHNTLGLCLARLGFVDEARQAYETALAINPEHALAKNNLASLNINRGRIRHAVPLLSSALASDPQSGLFRSNFQLMVVHLIRRLWWINLALAIVLAGLVSLGAPWFARAASGVALIAVESALVARVVGALPRGTLHRLPQMLRGTNRALPQLVVLAIVGAAFIALAFLPSDQAAGLDGPVASIGVEVFIGVGIGSLVRAYRLQRRNR
ncbi:MAG TPA: tetratricopeptide repeat protein, partial [Marmoricola sp.]